LRILTAVLLLVGSAFAGTPGVASFKIIPGVREAGMAGVGVASAVGPQAIALNPAAGAGIRSFSAVASYSKWALDSRHQSAFVGRNLSVLNVGFGVSSFSSGVFEYRIRPSEVPLGTFTPTDISAYLNVARSFGSIVQAGLTGRYYYSRVLDDDAGGFGVDGGVRVMPLKGLALGASVVDLGKTMSYRREVFWLPTRARLGAKYDVHPFERGRVTVAADAGYLPNTREFGLALGGEFAFADVVALRAGYDVLSDGGRLAFGLGLRAAALRFDYSLVALGFDMGMAHRISVALGQ
jgi:hypothetical protein